MRRFYKWKGICKSTYLLVNPFKNEGTYMKSYKDAIYALSKRQYKNTEVSYNSKIHNTKNTKDDLLLNPICT